MKKKNLIFRLSIILNAILLIAFILSEFGWTTKLYDRIVPPKKYSVVMFGNSMSARGKWDWRSDVKKSGMNGYTTSHYVWILQKSVIQYDPKICFIDGGINDIGVGVPLSRTFQNYQLLVDTLLKYKIEPVLQSTFYVNYPGDSLTDLMNSKVDSLNNYLSALAHKKGVKYLDINQFLSENKRLKAEVNLDGIHLNETGYRIWEKEIDKVLKEKGF